MTPYVSELCNPARLHFLLLLPVLPNLLLLFLPPSSLPSPSPSAGGNSVINHLVREQSFPLYRRAIIESGTYNLGALSAAAASTHYAMAVKQAGCGPSSAQEDGGVSSELSCLVGLSATALSTVSTALNKVQEAWGPIVDGVSLLAPPTDLIAEGKYNNKVRAYLVCARVLEYR